MINKQIISRFYLIIIDNKPVYIGLTNRPIKVRFTEHKHAKELPDNARVQEIDKLVYDFTWDVAVVNKNAREVSNREPELIEQYNTQASEYQKKIGGGTVWAEIKHFVAFNKEDPFWKGISEGIILEMIEITRTKKQRLKNVINGTKSTQRLENVINHTTTTGRLEHVIRDTKLTRRLENVIYNTRTTKRLEHVINHTTTNQRLDNVINNTRIK